MRLLLRAAFLGAPLWAGSPGLARAATPPSMTWETSVDGGCRVRPAQLAREVDLACDALGKTCRRVERGGEARAVLACADASAWTVEARDAKGAHLWTLAIGGAHESRVRIAAMWIARAERDAPPPDAPVIPMVEVVKADATQTEAPTPEPAKSEPAKSEIAEAEAAPKSTAKPDASSSMPPSPRAPSPDVSAPDAGARDAPSARGHGGVLAHVGGTLSSGVASQGIGAGARFAIALPLGLNAGLSVAASRSLGSSSGYTLSTGRAGAIVGWGAPWSTGPLGASIEAGALVGSVDTQSSVSPSGRAFGVPYAEVALVAAMPSRRAFRPFVALTLMGLARPIRVTESGQEVAAQTQATAGIDVGLAWAAW